MKERTKKILFNLFMFIAVVATSRYTWFGTYKKEIPDSLKNRDSN